MPDRRQLVLGLVAAVATPVMTATKAASAAVPSADVALLQRAFGAGGAALILRHAQTEPGIGDPPGYRLDDCSTQRNLSAAGRAQARAAAAVLAAAALRVDEVRSSRWCRCIDTARLLLPGREVQVLDALNSFFDDRTQATAQTEALRRYLVQLGQRNALLVTHQVNITALAGTSVAMGEGVVVQANAAGVRVLGGVRLA
jgi:broad specificity phosphatase PhoE